MKTKKRFSKLTAWLLTLAMVVTFIPSFTIGVSASGETHVSPYEQMFEHITPENNYGLGDIPESRIFHAWGWSYQNIIEKLEIIAEQGFSTILVSPPNEIKMPTEGVKFHEPETDGISPNGWWMLYQPAGFQINESSDNALGTKSEFVELCKDAHDLGFKIIVEAIVGYAGTDDDHVGEYDNVSTNPMEHVNPRMAEFEPELFAAQAFHSPWVNCTYKENYRDGYSDYDIEEDLTQHAVDGKPDLATEEQVVQDAIYDYFIELVEAGADGFYFNDAKHIETSSDTSFPSDFWEDTLGKIRQNYPDKNLQAVAELIGGSGDGRGPEEYLQYGMNLTHTAMSDTIRDGVVNGTDITDAFDDAFPQENSVLWGESYKSYANGETSDLSAEQRAKIWALTVSRKGVKGIYLGRPSDELAEGKDEVNNILSNITLGEANVTDWRTDVIKRINHFASFFENAEENVHYDNGFAVIERGELGAVLVNMQGKDAAVSLNENTLVDGEYTDSITGNIFTIVNGEIFGEIGASGIAVLYQSGPVQNYDLWVGGEQFASKKLTITDGNGGTATYDPESNTLTLNNYTYEGEGYEYAAIYYNRHRNNGSPTLNLVLLGENSVIHSGALNESSGVNVFGNLNISGTGSLTTTGGIASDGWSRGIYVEDSLTISGGIVTAKGGVANYNSVGIMTYGDITISDGTVETIGGMGSGSYGMRNESSNSTITVSSTGSLIATGGAAPDGFSYGIYGDGSLTISGGAVKATGSTAYNSIGIAVSNTTISGGETIVQGETRAFYFVPNIDDDLAVYDADGAVIENPVWMDEGAMNYAKIAEKTGSYTITFNPNGGSVEPETMETVDYKLESLPTPTRSGYNFKGWYDAETGGNKITTDTVFTENTAVYAQWSKRSSGGGSYSNTTTTTTKNEDGSTTKTTTNKSTGTVTEVTTNTDGSTTTVETKKDGTVTTTEKDKDGNTTTTVEKSDGTSTTTEKNKDGSEKVTEEKADGTTVTTEKNTDGTKTVTTENADGSTTTEETKKDGTKVTTQTTADGETKTEIDLPKDKETEVTIPAPNAEDVTSVTVTDKDGKETEITDFEITEDGVKLTVSGDCTAVINKAAKKEFADVHPVNHWATADIDYAYIKGLMRGTSENHFSPDVPLTRAMLVTVLYRLEGEPATNKSIPFADVDMGAYYGNAVSWAKQNGIVNGTTDTTFAPNDNITREQIAAIMYRYAQYKGFDVTQGGMLVREYNDYEAISDYALSSMTWAVNAGLLKGKGNNNLAPQDNATRAEIAAILHRFIEANK